MYAAASPRRPLKPSVTRQPYHGRGSNYIRVSSQDPDLGRRHRDAGSNTHIYPIKNSFFNHERSRDYGRSHGYRGYEGIHNENSRVHRYKSDIDQGR